MGCIRLTQHLQMEEECARVGVILLMRQVPMVVMLPAAGFIRLMRRLPMEDVFALEADIGLMRQVQMDEMLHVAGCTPLMPHPAMVGEPAMAGYIAVDRICAFMKDSKCITR